MPHVLVVDDEKGVRTIVRRILETDGYTVLEAADGLAALDALQTCHSSMVVVLDYLMPHRNGGEVLCDLAADAHLRDGHVFMMLTAQQGNITDEQRHVMAALDVPVVTKPFSMDGLLATVARAAEKLPKAS
jgi:CheY-like chemotaxis protein